MKKGFLAPIAALSFSEEARRRKDIAESGIKLLKKWVTLIFNP